MQADSDQVGVALADEILEWDLLLVAACADNPQAVVRLLSSSVLACGGWVLSRSRPGSDTAEISFEFTRVSSMEMYGVLIAAGLELSREAHIKITELCQCTKNLLATKAFDIARVRLLIFPATTPEAVNEKEPRSGKMI